MRGGAIACLALLAACERDQALFVRAAVPDAGVADGAATACELPAARAICLTEPAAGAFDLIDDLEDGDLGVARLDGRDGSWQQSHDPTGGARHFPEPLAPTALPGCADRYAIRLAGCGHHLFSIVNFDFHQRRIVANSYTSEPLDLSGYTGLAFHARSDTSSTIDVRFPNRDTDPRGGVCGAATDPVTANAGCYSDFERPIALTPQWQWHRVRFSDVAQIPYFGMKFPAFDARHVYGVTFGMPVIGGDPIAAYDVWIDDVVLTRD